MNGTNTKYLYDKYPKIFAQHTLPMTETCMCWNFECGDGWKDLLDNLCNKIQEHVDKNNLDQVEAVQVKEKFGGLRFYINGADDYVHKLVDEAENKSYETCEHCGSTEDIKQTTGWIVTLCPKCMIEYRKERFGKEDNDKA